jgi:hypothetical protein
MNPSNATVSPLRQRMLDDMRMRNLAPKTQSAYVRAVPMLLPARFHRIRHYGLLANANHKHDIALARGLLGMQVPQERTEHAQAPLEAERTTPTFICRHCGCAMTIVEIFLRAQTIRGPPPTGPSP